MPEQSYELPGVPKPINDYIGRWVAPIIHLRDRLHLANWGDADLAIFLPASRDIEIDEALEGGILFGLPVRLHLGSQVYIGVAATLNSGESNE